MRGEAVLCVYSSQQYHSVSYSHSHFTDDTVEVQGGQKTFLVGWNLNPAFSFFFFFYCTCYSKG